MITTGRFVACAEEIAAEEPQYKLGCDGSHGYCDCIGLIIGAIRRAGGQWRGLHGSNYAARREIEKMLPCSAASDLQIGEAVFKAYAPGQGGYSLPKRYEIGEEFYTGDLNDYYHVGIVESVSPLRIRHMTTPKPKMDTKLGKWSYHGKLKKISYGGDVPVEPYQARVVGGKLNLREQPSVTADRLCQIPEGTILHISDEAQDWAMTSYNGMTGWVLKKFLEPVGNDVDTVTVSRKDLEAIYDTIGDWLGLRG